MSDYDARLDDGDANDDPFEEFAEMFNDDDEHCRCRRTDVDQYDASYCPIHGGGK
jgi:hypothetical protein